MSVKYKSTPRDLFNPPPQAIDFGNKYASEEIEQNIIECYPDFFHPVRRLWERTIRIIAEHEGVIGVKL